MGTDRRRYLNHCLLPTVDISDREDRAPSEKIAVCSDGTPKLQVRPGARERRPTASCAVVSLDVVARPRLRRHERTVRTVLPGLLYLYPFSLLPFLVRRRRNTVRAVQLAVSRSLFSDASFADDCPKTVQSVRPTQRPTAADRWSCGRIPLSPPRSKYRQKSPFRRSASSVRKRVDGLVQREL
jgi:hypothetical protein